MRVSEIRVGLKLANKLANDHNFIGAKIIDIEVAENNGAVCLVLGHPDWDGNKHLYVEVPGWFVVSNSSTWPHNNVR